MALSEDPWELSLCDIFSIETISQHTKVKRAKTSSIFKLLTLTKKGVF